MKFLLLISLLYISAIAYGQKETLVDKIINNSFLESPPPKMIIKFDSIEVLLDADTQKDITPQMIKKAAFEKSNNSLITDSTSGNIIYIYIKKRYEKKLISMLAENKGLVINKDIRQQLKEKDIEIRAGIGFDNYQINSTCLLNILADFGNSYYLNKYENDIYELEYLKLGLSFYFHQPTGDAKLYCIAFYAPFKGITEKKVKLKTSTMLNVQEQYGEINWYTTKNSYCWWSDYDGIEFGVEQDADLQTFPLNEEIHEKKKIEEIRVWNEDEHLAKKNADEHQP